MIRNHNLSSARPIAKAGFKASFSAHEEMNVSYGSKVLIDLTVQNIINILKKPHNQRTPEDLDEFVPKMREVQFFQEREIKDQDFLEIVSALKYETFKRKQVIFHFGDLGDKFYILIQGEVGVLIPNPKIKNSRDLMMSIVNDINQINNDLQILQDLINVKESVYRELDDYKLQSQDTIQPKKVQEKNVHGIFKSA